ncbi:acrosin-like [Manacus vitellinus]|uniref:acrosin-like n=1 Tax=Manacus vitellinus TaxID=328815 RepID=UPI00115CDEE0|nr:acrosin-like [Manacus vitellinus]
MSIHQIYMSTHQIYVSTHKIYVFPKRSRGTCGLRPMASDHNSLLPDYDTDDNYGAVDSSGGTVRGNDVAPGTWPGIVSIQANWANGTWHMCAGALINPKWVLTVAHCFYGAKDVSKWEVVLGATDLTELGPEAELHHIQRLLVHQHYAPALARNNIALLELDEPVECSDYIQLGCVPNTPLSVSQMKTCYIAGWKTTLDSALRPRLVLQEAKVRLIDVQLCNSSRWYGGAVHPHDLCAGYPRGGIDTCQGDSGGPLVCKDMRADYFWFVGMTSWGKGCAGAKRPGIFTSTQEFHNWILIQMGLLPVVTAIPTPEPTTTSTPEQNPEPESSLSSMETLMPMELGNLTAISIQQQILGQFFNLILELLQFLRAKLY